MKSVVFPYKTSRENKELLKELRRKQSIVIRTAYNEYFEGNMDVKNITDKVSKYGLDLPATFVLYGIREGKAIFDSQQKIKEHNKKSLQKTKEQLQQKLKKLSERKIKNRCQKYRKLLNKLIVVSNKLKNIDSQRIVFGSKNLFYKRIKNKITKQEFKDSRLCNLFISGETSYKGNRHCLLDMKNRTLTIKVNKQIKPIVLSIPKNFKNLEEELCKLVEQCNKKENKFSVVIKNDTVSISYEEFKNEEVFEKINNRILAFDDNPNYIGISITDWKNKENIKPSRIIYQEVIDKTNLIDGRYEGDTKKKFVKNATTNKIKYETFIISKHIIKLCKHFKCSMIVKENLVIYSSNKKKGRKFNRLCNNDWNRTLFSNNLKKKCVENNIDLVEVNCANSSKLGNVLYGKDDGTIPDMIASSIELARRSFKYYKAKNNKFYFNKDERLYPEWNILKKELNRWKKEALQSSCMEQFFKLLVGDSYRVKFREISGVTIRNSLDNIKSQVILHGFK